METADIRAQDKTRADNSAQILSARYCLPVVVYKLVAAHCCSSLCTTGTEFTMAA